VSETEFDVVISGFGPTGAALAALLGQAGHRVCVIERDREVYALPRAVHFDQEVMRVFQTLGLAEKILPITRATDFAEFWTADREVLIHVPFNEITDQGWRSDYMFHQPSLERVLRESAESYPNVEIRYGETSAFRSGTDGVELDFVPDDGSSSPVRGRFLVGCDGANSLVRRTAGLELDDLAFDEPWLVVDIEGVNEADMPGGAIQYCNPERPSTLVPCAGGFYRFEFMLRPDEGEEMLRPENVDRLLSDWVDPASVKLVRAAVYRFHALVATTWRNGRALIAGDAAHQTPPFLGQGMCAGIRDTINLSWKLDRVLRGTSPIEVLDTYGSERTPHVREFVARAVAAGRIICVQDPEQARQRDEAMLGARERGDAPPVPMSLPLLGDGFFSEDAGPDRHALIAKLSPQPELKTPDGPKLMDDATGHRFQLVHRASSELSDGALERLAQLDGAAVPWPDTDYFDRHGVEAILVRPDHVIFGVAAGSTDIGPLLDRALGGLGGDQPGV
jgi:3-(3-hydroxy-phenyl)propionate hydroxylase